MMFELAILFLALGFFLGITGFFLALGYSSRLRRIEERLDATDSLSGDLSRRLELLASAVRRAPSAAATAQGDEPPPPPLPSAADLPPPPPLDASATGRPAVDAEPEAKAAFSPTAGEVAADEPLPPPPPARSLGLEERLGTRWAVWVGGLALALGALLLVRYSIERGFFGPGLRVSLGAALSLALIAASEWLRRSDKRLETALVATANIPSVLTAAGTVGLFGTLYAAHALYQFIGPAVAFAALGAVALATLAAARVHGPSLAGLGIAGALLTPLLVSSETPSPWPVVVYLAVVAAAGYWLAADRGWRWLAVTTGAGGALWSFLMASEMGRTSLWIAPAIVHGALQLALAVHAYAVRTRDAYSADGSSEARVDGPGHATLAGLTAAALAIVISNDGVSPAIVIFSGAVTLLLLAAAWLTPRLAGASGIAGAFLLATLLAWPSLIGSRFDLTAPTPDILGFFSAPYFPEAFLAIAAIASLAVAAVAGLRLLTAPSAAPWVAANLAGAAVLTPLGALTLAYLRMTNFSTSVVFALAALTLAAILVLATLVFRSAERKTPASSLSFATGAFAAATVAATSLALVFYLDRGALTVALAVTALGTAVVSHAMELPMLRAAVSALGLVVLARVVWEPRIMGDDLGRRPILNWLLFGYGVPAISLFAAARVLERRGVDLASRLSDALWPLFTGLLFFFEIRHALNDGDITASRTDHMELGLMALTAAGMSFALMRSRVTAGNPVLQWAALAYAAAGAVVTVLGLVLGKNPYLSGDPILAIGPLNSLWLGYLLPSLAIAFLARKARGTWPDLAVHLAGAVSLALIFLFVSLSVRHSFHGESIGFLKSTSDSEFWTYSAAWLALGIALLGYGLWRRLPEARLASAAIVVLTILKVFLLDMAGLEGALRAFSFIGLGLTLLGIGYIYQRWIFTADARES